jgi:hypothetical protein
MSNATIDRDDEQDVQTWADKLDVSATQIRDAVDEVGSRAADVEQHLKGVRATTNSERTDQAG